jgi:Domain of unknown function (DUF4158)
MPSVSDTAYPRFKINPSAKELNDLYTPTVYELAFAREQARQPLQRAGLLLLLKAFQRLGHFALCVEIPAPIVRHIFRLRCFGRVTRTAASLRCQYSPRSTHHSDP